MKLFLALALCIAARGDDVRVPDTSAANAALHGLAQHVPDAPTPVKPAPPAFHIPRAATQAPPAAVSYDAKTPLSTNAPSRANTAPFMIPTAAPAPLSLVWLGLLCCPCLFALRGAFCYVTRKAGLYNPDWEWLWLPYWRTLFRVIALPVIWWWEERVYMGRQASARPAGFWETASALYRPGDIYLGRLRIFGIPAFQPIGLANDGRHLCMVAGTGSGKTVQLITLLGLHPGNALIVDPKAQIAKVLAKRMNKGGEGTTGKNLKLAVLDPSGVSGEPSANWNCWDEVGLARKRAIAAGRNPDDATVEFVQKIVDGLVVVSSAKADPFWPGAAKDLTVGAALWMDKRMSRDKCTLATLYDILTVGLLEQAKDGESGFDALLRVMSSDSAYGGIIASSAAGVRDASDNTAGGVLITLREQLKWMKRPGLSAQFQRGATSASKNYTTLTASWCSL